MTNIFWNNKSNIKDLSSMTFQSEYSASELSYLRAEVWSLKNKLKDEEISTKNLSESFRKLANEKYELLEELTRQNLSVHELYVKLDRERY